MIKHLLLSRLYSQKCVCLFPYLFISLGPKRIYISEFFTIQKTPWSNRSSSSSANTTLSLSLKISVVTGGLEGKKVQPPLLPPTNFSAVVDHTIYRSTFPEPCNLQFLQSLKLSSIIFLCSGRYPKENLQFLQSNKIKLFQLGIDGKDEETFPIPWSTITDAFKILNDERNHPVLVHCKAGMHRTGCLVGGLRKLHNWCKTPVLEEYKKFAGKRFREIDLKFLKEYDVSYLRDCSTASFPGTRCPCCPVMMLA